MAEKVTWMVLKVDLQCSSCYKKVKKTLCKFPQIRDQVYDEQKNLVRITVVCCSPEKIRDKLCCKGGKVIKSIEIVEPPKAPSKPKDGEKPKAAPPAHKPKDEEKPKTTRPRPPVDKPTDLEKWSDDTPTPAPVPVILPPPPPVVPARPDAYPVPVGFCCARCFHGRGGGPCYDGYWRPVPPPPCYDNYYYSSYEYAKGCYTSRCDYFSEGNTSGCRIM